MDMQHCQGTFTTKPCYRLDKYQREAIGLLQIGTFLEYFDLMLYVHMAVVLNAFFFPKMDNHAEAIFAAMSFSSIYLLRPVGAVIFGYIGDMIGRKATIVITTGTMAITCLILATLPTFAEIGYTATYIFFACRLFQGVSSMGEVVGSQVYATELVAPPRRYVAVSLVDLFTNVGGLAALAVTWYVVNVVGNWRIAFWIGSCIAVVGSVARLRLRETPEFVNHLKSIRLKAKNNRQSRLKIFYKNSWQELKKKKSLAFLCIKQVYPVTFFVGYVHFNIFLKQTFSLTAESLVTHNLHISLISTAMLIGVVYLTTKISPVKLYTGLSYIFIIGFLIAMIVLLNTPTLKQLMIIQLFFVFIGASPTVLSGYMINHFTMGQRFTVTSIVWSASRLTAHLIFIVGLVWLNERIGFHALWIIFIPLIIMNLWGLSYYRKIDKQRTGLMKIMHKKIPYENLEFSLKE